jgi:hypothetical protein
MLFGSFWIVVVAYIVHFMIVNGGYYVNWPKLIPLEYDVQASEFPGIQSEAKLGTAEVELGWKNE